MMGLNHQDVALMMQGLEAPGNAIAQNRQEADKRQQLQIENDVRQRQLDIETRRMQSEQDRNDLLGQGSVNTTLQDEEGNQISWKGPSKAYTGFVDNLTAKTGKDWKPVSQPKKTPYSVKLNMPDGEMELHANDLDELQTQVDHMRKANKTTSKNTSPTYGPVQADKAAAEFEDKRDELLGQANMLESAASTRGPGPTGDDIYGRIESLKSQADKFDQRAKFLRQPKTDPTQLQTVTTTEEEGLPGMPPKTKTVVSGKQRPGAAPAPRAAAPAGDAELQQAKQAISSGKDPAAVKALYKKRTGKDYPE